MTIYTKQNVQEIRKILPDLSTWLVTNTVHQGSATFCLEAILNKLQEEEEELND